MNATLHPLARVVVVMGVLCLLFMIASLVFVCAILRHEGFVGDRFSRQMYTADVIARALVGYERAHGGMIPASIASLDLDGAVSSDEGAVSSENVARFHMLHAGARTGARDCDVVFESVEEPPFPAWVGFLNTFPESTVRIYRDGQVRSEFRDKKEIEKLHRYER